MYSGIQYRKRFKPPKKINFLSVILILAGILLVIFFTPPQVWLVLLGLGLILAGLFNMKKRR